MNSPITSASSKGFGDITAVFHQAVSEQRDSLSTLEIGQLLAKTPLNSQLQSENSSQPKCCDRAAGPVPLSLTITRSREFGMIIGANIDCSVRQKRYFESTSKSFSMGVSAATELVGGRAFCDLFSHSYAYLKFTDPSEGQPDADNNLDTNLANSFSALIDLANTFSPSNPEAPYVIESLTLEVRAGGEGQLLVFAGHCRFSKASLVHGTKPIDKIDKLFHPTSIGLIGVSANKLNFGRIILRNLIDSGYDKSRMKVIKPQEDNIDGVTCIDSLKVLDQKLDLLIVAIAADAVYDLVDEIIVLNAAESVMLVPGGLGETEASLEPAARMVERIKEAHRHGDGGPVFLGGNCLGVVSHPGGYDSWFIPQERLPKPQKKAQRNSALISQSGAFMVNRLSKNPWLDPAYMVALGNQSDVTHGDMISYFADKEGIECIGVYIEGFKDLDGLAFAKAVRRAALKGKQVVVYKAGRNFAGQTAAMAHTASIAGDYDVCKSILEQAGVLIANDFSEFDDLFYAASLLHEKTMKGSRLAAVSGAGFETVGIADSINQGGCAMTMAAIETKTAQRLAQILKDKKLDALMSVRNPFDINPGADDEAHLLCTQAFAEDLNVDAVVVGLDPGSPAMRTLARSSREGFDIHSEHSIVNSLPKLVAEQHKPIIGIIDAGTLYDPMAEALMDQGVCIFRSCERGVRALVKIASARLAAQQLRGDLLK